MCLSLCLKVFECAWMRRGWFKAKEKPSSDTKFDGSLDDLSLLTIRFAVESKKTKIKRNKHFNPDEKEKEY